MEALAGLILMSRAAMSQTLLFSLLRESSRSFYLTLRVLPKQIRPQIGLAYLLARTSDTIADTELFPLDERLAGLESLRQRILGLRTEPLDLARIAQQQSLRVERALLERSEDSLGLLETMSPGDRQRVQDVLTTIIGGQDLDLRRFAGAAEGRIVALERKADLDDYTYRVAGCVGEFWTRMCRAHLFPEADLSEEEFLANGVRFGKGLQLTNILRDLPRDLRQGRCYLPSESLKASGLEPADLLNPKNEPRARGCFNEHLEIAEGFLAAGWSYTNLIPRRCMRVKLACAWPLLIGRQTLGLLRASNFLDPKQRIKISRRQVRSILWKSVVYYPWPKAWTRLFPGFAQN
jgi:farnesyl-diphosphate farnesyltransferase